MAYGTIAGVQAYCASFTNAAGVFDSDTTPKAHQVTAWLNQISNSLDLLLAKEGFTVPVTNATAVSAMTSVVEQLVTDLVNFANRAGRFYTERSQQYGVSPWKVIASDLEAWVSDNAPGLSAAGASRGESSDDRFVYRDTDESGDPVTPIFQRKGFGNTFEDWTTP